MLNSYLSIASGGSSMSYGSHGRIYDPASSDPYSHYMPSLMVNGSGDMAVGFSGSKVCEYIGAFCSWRLANGTTPDRPLLIKAGRAYRSSPEWGDARGVVRPTGRAHRQGHLTIARLGSEKEDDEMDRACNPQSRVGRHPDRARQEADGRTERRRRSQERARVLDCDRRGLGAHTAFSSPSERCSVLDELVDQAHQRTEFTEGAPFPKEREPPADSILFSNVGTVLGPAA